MRSKRTEEYSADVLLVDDEKDFLELLSERLTNRGMHVTSASSGKEALDLIEDRNSISS